MKHTKGEWYWCTNQYTTEIKTRKKHKKSFPSHRADLICSVRGLNKESNACLISSAPELLEALMLIVSEFEESRLDFCGQLLPINNSSIDKAKKVIKKAQGND